MKLVRGQKIFFYLSLGLFLTFFKITRHENWDVHFHAVLAFVVWEESGMELLVLKIVRLVGWTSEAVVPFLCVPVK